MTTAQESTNGHRVSPHPCSFPDSQEENQSKDSSNNNSQFTQHGNGVVERQKDVSSPESHGDQELSRVKKSTPLLAHEKVAETFPANAYHVPPARYAPKANSYRYDDFPSAEIDTDPLPERCQFMFSDGRQCTMGRSEIHPSLCPYHSEREDQLFGTPSSEGSVVGAAFDLPELYSACRDLTTAAGVNRALAQVFRLLAQRRISRQEAATFAKLGHLLLQTISAARTDSTDPASPPRKGYQQDALFAGNKVVPSEHHERGAQFASCTLLRGIPPEPVPDREMSPASLPPRDAVPAPQPQNGTLARQLVRSSLNSSTPLRPPAAASKELSEPTAAKNSLGINTSADSIRNSREINTSEIAGLKIAQNQHLQKNGGDNPISESSSIKLGRTGSEGAERVPDNHENGRKT